MTRFNDKRDLEQNITPKILSLPVILQNRNIASISPLKNKKEALNNKQLYFQILNTQMHKMGDILNKKIINNRCPHFHSINLSVIKNLRVNVLEERKNLPENNHYTNALKASILSRTSSSAQENKKLRQFLIWQKIKKI